MQEVWTQSIWWLSARGLLAIVFAVFAVAWPDKDWFTLLSIYAAYALLDGVALFLQASRGGRTQRADPWPLLFIAILGVSAGIATLYYWAGRPDDRVPDLPLVNPQLIVLVGWAIARGVYEIIAAVRLWREIEGEWLLAGTGALSLVFAVLVAAQFGAAASITWAIAICLILAGALYIALSIRLSHRGGGYPHAPGTAR